MGELIRSSVAKNVKTDTITIWPKEAGLIVVG
jgi:hypothetical protein